MWSEIMGIIMLILSLFNPLTTIHNTKTVALSTSTATVLKVIDGDTIEVLLNGKEVRVRYIGIDTPEPYIGDVPECGSYESTARNKELVEGRLVMLVTDEEMYDMYQRLLAYVYVDNVFINEVLVQEGFADTLSIPPNIRHAEQFKVLRESAKAAKRGNWRLCSDV